MQPEEAMFCIYNDMSLLTFYNEDSNNVSSSKKMPFRTSMTVKTPSVKLLGSLFLYELSEVY